MPRATYPEIPNLLTSIHPARKDVNAPVTNTMHQTILHRSIHSKTCAIPATRLPPRQRIQHPWGPKRMDSRQRALHPQAETRPPVPIRNTCPPIARLPLRLEMEALILRWVVSFSVDHAQSALPLRRPRLCSTIRAVEAVAKRG